MEIERNQLSTLPPYLHSVPYEFINPMKISESHENFSKLILENVGKGL
jgi:hypothetical protein